MPRYHFNPQTGNPNVCRAKPGKCPYISEGVGHFTSKEESRAAAEEFYSKTYVSPYARLLVARQRLQERINAILDRPDKELRRDELNALVAERNAMDKVLGELVATPDGTASLDRSHEVWKVPENKLVTRKGNKLWGSANTFESIVRLDETLYRNLVALSESWATSLSTKDAHAMNEYASGVNMTERHAELNAILEKSPRLSPTTVWSGLSVHVAKDVLSQYESGTVTLGYPISTTLNAAQVNGFMEMTLERPNDLYAIELETTRGASMLAFSHNTREMELLVPAGTYEVLGVEENVKFIWESKKYEESGRVATKLIKLRRKD